MFVVAIQLLELNYPCLSGILRGCTFLKHTDSVNRLLPLSIEIRHCWTNRWPRTNICHPGCWLETFASSLLKRWRQRCWCWWHLRERTRTFIRALGKKRWRIKGTVHFLFLLLNTTAAGIYPNVLQGFQLDGLGRRVYSTAHSCVNTRVGADATVTPHTRVGRVDDSGQTKDGTCGVCPSWTLALNSVDWPGSYVTLSCTKKCI